MLGPGCTASGMLAEVLSVLSAGLGGRRVSWEKEEEEEQGGGGRGGGTGRGR